MTRVDIYNRCSTEEEAQKNALEIQAKESRQIAEDKGWTIINQFKESHTGTVGDREYYKQLLDDIENERIDVVMIKSEDRLNRNVKDWVLFIDSILKHNIKLYLYLENKWYNREDDLIFNIRATLAAQFSSDLSKKIKHAHRGRQQEKRAVNISRKMFGWDKVGKAEFVVNEEEANLYRIACNLVEQGYGYRRISNKMYELGARQSGDKYMGEIMWRNMLLSPRYHGEVVMHYEELDFYTKKRNKLPEDEWIIANDLLPPIVDKEYHEKIIKILNERAEQYKDKGICSIKANLAGKYTLSKKIYCAKCGNTYYRQIHQFKNGKRADWMCSTYFQRGMEGCDNIKVDEEELMELIQQACKEHYSKLYLDDDSLINQTLDILKRTFNSNELEDKEKRLIKRIEKIKSDKKIWMQKLIDGVIDDDDYKEYKIEMDETLHNLDTQLDSIKEQIEKFESSAERLQKIRCAMINDSIVDRAKTEQLSKKVVKVLIQENGDIDIYFSMAQLLEFEETQTEKGNDSDDKYYIVTKHYERVRPETIRKKQQEEEVYQLLKENPKITMTEIEKLIGITNTTVYLRLKELKKQGRITYKRYQGNKGHWEII